MTLVILVLSIWKIILANKLETEDKFCLGLISLYTSDKIVVKFSFYRIDSWDNEEF